MDKIIAWILLCGAFGLSLMGYASKAESLQKNEIEILKPDGKAFGKYPRSSIFYGPDCVRIEVNASETMYLRHGFIFREIK